MPARAALALSAAAAPPRTRFPPILVYLAAYGAALYLDRRLPFDIDGDGAGIAQRAVGTALAAAGLFLIGWALRTMILARTTVMPHRAARALMTDGPFRLTRNPMYVGLLSIYLGAAVIFNDAWPLVLVPAVVMTMTSRVIAKEEAHLTQAFGDDYRRYTARVRRWV